MLLKFNLGLSYTKSMKGFISAEHGFSEQGPNNLVWYLWKKWGKKADYENYIQTPTRNKNSKFAKVLLDCLDGETSETWIDLL